MRGRDANCRGEFRQRAVAVLRLNFVSQLAKSPLTTLGVGDNFPGLDYGVVVIDTLGCQWCSCVGRCYIGSERSRFALPSWHFVPP
jgi:hypothetical protein